MDNLYQRAWGSAGATAAYERARPGYPEAAVDFLAAVLHLGPTSIVIDVGAGTGKLTRSLLRLGASVVAVEPLADMRLQFRTSVPGTAVLAGRAEALPARPQSADAIVAGQAWHWFDCKSAVSEAERVLKPGGGVGLLWNDYDESAPWVAELARIRDASKLASPHQSTREWQKGFAGRPRWDDLQQRSFSHLQTVSRHQLVERVTSSSVIAALSPIEQDRITNQILRVLDTHPETRDARDIAVPYRTEVYWTKFRTQ